MNLAAASRVPEILQFYGQAAWSEWRALLAHLDLADQFALFLLLVPAKAGASVCEKAIADHLRARGKELLRVRPADTTALGRLPEQLLNLEHKGAPGALWVELLGPAAQASQEWQASCRKALALLNQHRNHLQHCVPMPVVFIGGPWLQPAFREAAPDLWSIRSAVTRLEESAEPGAPLDLPFTLFPGMAATNVEAVGDPDYALEQADRLRQRPELSDARAALLLRASAGFSDQRRSELAEAAAQEAAELYRRLARESPDAFTPDLASALNNLAIRLSALGRRAEALASEQEAVGLYRQLAAGNPDAFRPHLAGSVNNLAILLSELGRRAEALAPAQEAVDIRRQLAERNPGGFKPDLAASLYNLAIALSESGRRAEALGPGQAAVGLYRQLANRDPDAFTPDLAMSLNNLAVFLSQLGRRTQALASAHEAWFCKANLPSAIPMPSGPL